MRLNINISEETHDQLEDLTSTEVTKTEVIRHAVRVYRLLTSLQRQGYRIEASKDGVQERLILL